MDHFVHKISKIRKLEIKNGISESLKSNKSDVTNDSLSELKIGENNAILIQIQKGNSLTNLL